MLKFSEEKKILKATRGGKTLWTKNQKLTVDLTKMMQVKRQRRSIIKGTKLSRRILYLVKILPKNDGEMRF